MNAAALPPSVLVKIGLLEQACIGMVTNWRPAAKSSAAEDRGAI